MELSYSEKIIEKTKNGLLQDSIAALQDCFTIQRIERALGALSGPAAFNESSRKEMVKLYDELDLILVKYGLPKTTEE